MLTYPTYLYFMDVINEFQDDARSSLLGPQEVLERVFLGPSGLHVYQKGSMNTKLCHFGIIKTCIFYDNTRTNFL